MEALHHLAGTVLEHAPAVERAVEVFDEVQLGFFLPVGVDGRAGAAGEAEG